MAFSLLPQTFDDVKTYLTDKISEKYPSLGTFLENSMLIIFVDIIAWAIALFMDYADNLWSENILSTTINYENARKQAEFYGHVASRKVSAKGTIRVGMNENFDSLPLESIVFNRFDSLTINGISYLVDETTVFSNNPNDQAYDELSAGLYYIEVPVIQGQLTTISRSAQGSQNEVISIEDDSIENSYISVSVNSTEWEEQESFFLSNSTDEHYAPENISNMLGLNINFGDGYRGKQLSSGDTIEIDYIKTDALEGQIKATGFEVIFNEAYTYSDTTPVEFYAYNDSQLIGASDIETIESLKYWGKIAASSMTDKAFTSEELGLELQEYGGILKSKAISEYDLSPTTPNEQYMNVVRLLIVPTSGTELDDTAKQNIRDYLRPKMDFTDFIQFIDVEYIEILFKLSMELNTSSPSNISSLIDNYLQEEYALGNTDFGESINHSSVVYNIQSNFSDYIYRFALYLWVVENLEDPTIATDGTISYTLNLGSLRAGLTNINSCKLIIDFNDGEEKEETLVDDGSGNIIPQGTSLSEVITSGTIDYVTGEIVLDIDPAVVSISNIETQYNPNDEDGNDENVDIKYNHICRYYGSEITVDYV